MSGLLAHQSNANADSTSVMIIEGLLEVDSEDWNQKLDRYVSSSVLILKIFVLVWTGHNDLSHCSYASNFYLLLLLSCAPSTTPKLHSKHYLPKAEWSKLTNGV
jgi:hypothetical protein